MFFRHKTTQGRRYLQIVENTREGKAVRQRVVATLGRVETLQASGELDRLLRSGARYVESALVVSAHDRGELASQGTCRIGPALVFERLWKETGCREVLGELLARRKFEFPVERAIFLEVLHRLFRPGSDRAGAAWRCDYAIEGTAGLALHHAYRAMAWLGDELPPDQQFGKTPFAPRTTKDVVEEALFARRRDLFTGLDLVFFDTTSLFFVGEGGATIGQYGHSKDHRPDHKQMVVAVVLDTAGRPVCCELWPGNTADVKTLIPIADRLEAKFGVRHICVVADRGMVSKETIAEFGRRKWLYVLGARMRSNHEVRDDVLARGGRYREVVGPRKKAKDPAPLKVKEVHTATGRYIVCVNEEEARKDAADREAIIEALREQLKSGAQSLVGNKGYRKYLKAEGAIFAIDEDKIQEEARYDGKWVIVTNTDMSAEEAALTYKQLLMVEQIFRTSKSILETRPIYHRHDETIRGHVFCSFLALVLRKELEERLDAAGCKFEWADLVRDLDALQEIEIQQDGKRFVLRTAPRGVAGKVTQAVGVALPPTIRQLAS